MAQPPKTVEGGRSTIAFTPTPRRFTKVPDRGTWSSIGNAGALREVMTIGEDDASRAEALAYYGRAVSEVDSLPDVWSQVEGFATALLGANHERHQKARSEWRGLLAILALAPEFAPRLQIMRIDLMSRGLYKSIVRKQPPRLLVFGENFTRESPLPITELGTLHLCPGTQPVGLLVPTTLVAATRSIREGIFGAGTQATAPWIRDGGIHDPISDPNARPRLTELHYRLLERYVGRLAVVARQTLDGLERNAPAGNDPIGARIRGMVRLLEAYQTDAARAAAAVAGTHDQSEIYEFQRATQFVPTRFTDRLYGTTMLQCVETGALHRDTPPRSHSRIRTRAACEGLFRDIVLADPALADMPAARFVVLNQTTVLHLREQPDRVRLLRQDAAMANVLVVTPDDLLTHTLVEISDGTVTGQTSVTPGDQVPNSHFVLPLTPLALLLLDNLGGQSPIIRFIKLSDGEIKVHLAVPLAAGPEGGRAPRSHVIERIYRLDGHARDEPRLIRRKQTDDLTLWPNLSGRVWNRFQVFAAADGLADQVLPLWPIEAGRLATILRQPRGETTAAARALDIGQDWKRIQTADINDKAALPVVMNDASATDPYDKRLIQTSFRPEGYLIAADSISIDAHSLALSGFVLLPAPRQLGHPAIAGAEIALDFGSTNTTVFIKAAGNAVPEPLPLIPRRMDVFTRADGRDTEPEFIPRAGLPVPFSTLLQYRNPLSTPLAAAEAVPGGAGYIFSSTDPNRALVRGPVFTGVVFDIKWLTSDRRPTNYFLEQAVLMILAELVDRGIDVNAVPSQVVWRLSYPSAFNAILERQYQSGFQRVLRSLTNGQIGEVQSESVCAARYFRAQQQGAAHGTTIVVDIGGGTSDIAVWQHNNEQFPLLWQSSVRFAGRELCVEPIAHDLLNAVGRGVTNHARDQSLLELVAAERGEGKQEFETAVQTLRGFPSRLGPNPQTDPVAWARWLNAVGIAINTPHFTDAFTDASATIDPEDQSNLVLDVATLGFSGLLWFIGRQLRAISRPRADGTTDLDRSLTQDVRICLGGRPSRMIEALMANRAGYEAAFKKVLLTAAEWPQDVNFGFDLSRHPKQEVAHGLLRPDMAFASIAAEATTILGEATTARDGRSDPADRPLPSERPNQALRIDPAAPELSALVACLADIEIDRRSQAKFLVIPGLPERLPALVTAANNRLDALHREGTQGAPGGTGDDLPAIGGGRRPMTMEVQPPFFILLHQLMRSLLNPSPRTGHRR